MKIIRHPVREKLQRPVAALGTFDGVHLGHRRVIEAAVRQAHQLGAHSAVITFDPHPQEIISPERGLRLLTTLKEREEIFCSLGADAVVVTLFSKKMSRLSRDEFVERYLVNKLNVRQVFVGYDYAFGRGRAAGAEELKKLGRRYGFGVTIIPPVRVKGEIAKSGKIREALGRGEFAHALRLLGHPYRITGKVIRGEGRGTTLGFPTANLKVDPRKLLPAEGVYVGFVDGLPAGRQARNAWSISATGRRSAPGRRWWRSICSASAAVLLGRTLKVDLLRRLRGEKQFADAWRLAAQIKKDIVRARAL